MQKVTVQRERMIIKRYVVFKISQIWKLKKKRHAYDGSRDSMKINKIRHCLTLLGHTKYKHNFNKCYNMIKPLFIDSLYQ
jgi:hypothetical protein